MKCELERRADGTHRGITVNLIGRWRRSVIPFRTICALLAQHLKVGKVILRDHSDKLEPAVVVLCSARKQVKRHAPESFTGRDLLRLSVIGNGDLQREETDLSRLAKDIVDGLKVAKRNAW